MIDTEARALVELLAVREHHYRHSIEGEYDANLFMSARLAIETLLSSHQTVGEARAAALEEAAKVADGVRDKFGSPTGSAYDNGLWDQAIRIASHIRSLKPSDPMPSPLPELQRLGQEFDAAGGGS